MSKFKYNGEVEVHIPGVGTVKPGQVIEAKVEINNPLFEEIKSESQKKREEIQKKGK